MSNLSLVALVILAACGYLVASSRLVLLNKFLFQHDGFRYPLLLSSVGMVFTCLASTVLAAIPVVTPKQEAVNVRMYLLGIMPLGLASALSVGLGNMASVHLDVGLLEMLKGFSPVFVQLIAVSLNLERFSWRPLLATLLIAAGSATTATTGVEAVSSLGLALHLASHVCEALRVCLAQMFMCNMKLPQFQTLKLMSSSCILFLAAGVAMLEWPSFVQEQGWRTVLANPQWYFMAASLGFCVNMLAYQVIRLAGSLTQKVLGTVKNVIVVLYAVSFLGEQISWQQGLGYATSMMGFALYQYAKIPSQDSESKPHKMQASKREDARADNGRVELIGSQQRGGRRRRTAESPV